jgi:hypothetical protein
MQGAAGGGDSALGAKKNEIEEATVGAANAVEATTRLHEPAIVAVDLSRVKTATGPGGF